MFKPITFLLNFVLILAVQILLLNDVVIRSAITLKGVPLFIPLIYPLIILLLPIRIAPWLALVLSLVTGLVMDMFCNTPGMHAAAMVLLGYTRIGLLNLFFQQNAKDLNDTVPNLFRMGFRSFVVYLFMACTIHHLFFYTLQIWSWRQSPYILLKTLVSVLMSVLLMVIIQLLFARQTNRK
jgi:rod shape-determining protein MreD